MNTVLVMYCSKHNGASTQIYAEWIAEELQTNSNKINEIKQNYLKDYNIIILGSELRNGNITGINSIVNNFDKISDKKIVMFICGENDFTDTKNRDKINIMLKRTIPQNILDKIKIFYLRGDEEYIDKTKLETIKENLFGIAGGGKKVQERQRKEIEEYIEKLRQTEYFTDKNNIKEIIEYCKE